MFKVVEVHSGYISSAIALIIHLVAIFYFLYILKTSHEGALPTSAEKKVVWYKAPETTPKPTTPSTSYQEPERQQPVTATALEAAPVTTPEIIIPQEQPVEVSPLRKGRSAQERRAAWAKPAAAATQEEPKKLTAGSLMDAISQEQARKRQAHAVYTKQEAIKQGIAAQMREITEGRLRHKVFSAMQMAFSLYKEKYVSPVPISSEIHLSLVINQQGEIVAVEVLRSTGTISLDEHLVKIIQSIKKIALPPSKNGQEFHTITFPGKVTIHAGSGQIIFDYKDASGIHIV